MHTQRLLAPVAGFIAALCCATTCWGQACGTEGATGADPCARNPDPREEWRLNLGGVSHHATDTAAPGHHWNQVNPGLGIELRQAGVPLTDAGDQWRTIATAGLFTDSRDYRSAYAGVAATYELATLGRTRIDGGAGAFMFYRSRSWDGGRQWSPAVLPVLNFTDVQTGLGFELIWRPPHTDGPATLYVQVTLRLGPAPASARTRTAVALADSIGDVRALLASKARREVLLDFDTPPPDTSMLGAASAPR
jgi:hypothetical protein